jgi:hypothetical protein
MTMGATDPKSLAVPEVNQECRDRIGKLNPDTAPLWGKMTAARMMAHCAEVMEVAGGKAIQGTPWFIKLLKPFIRKVVVGPKPFPQDTKTHPQYIQSGDRDFGAEQVRLLASLDAFTEMCAGRTKITHPFFGEMTVGEAGWGMYKHLDHHLVQFGV